VRYELRLRFTECQPIRHIHLKSFESFVVVYKRPFCGMCMTSVLFRSDFDEDDDDDEGGEGLCEQKEEPALRESSYVKQIGKF